MRGILITLIAFILPGTMFDRASAQSVTEKAKRDEIVLVEKSDPVMAAAMRKARVSLPEFFELAKARRPSITTMAIKVGVREDANNVEYFWINPFDKTATGYTGIINNTPRTVKSVKYRDRIQFAESEIVDWTYTENGKMQGNYTACAILSKESAAERDAFKARYGLDCNR